MLRGRETIRSPSVSSVRKRSLTVAALLNAQGSAHNEKMDVDE